MAKTSKDAKTLAATQVVAEAVAQSTTPEATKETTQETTPTTTHDVPEDAPVPKAKSREVKPREAWQAEDWLISNQTPSVMAFPELGQQAAAMLKPYTKDVAVRFQTAAMFDQFHANLAQLRTLCGWNEVRGVFVRSGETTTEQTTEETT
jgi:hypothetical protein